MNITPDPAAIDVAVAPSPAVPIEISLVPDSTAVAEEESLSDGVSSESSSSLTRKSYSIRFKRACVKTINGLRAVKKLSIKAACEQVGISPLSYHRWKKQVQKLQSLQNSEDHQNLLNGTSRRVSSGRKSSIDSIEAALTRRLLALREQGIQVNITRARREACKLSPEFREKTVKAQQRVMDRFIRKIGLTYRASTHVAQKHFKETEMAAKFFMEMVRDRVSVLPRIAVANMDQTPIAFSYHEKRTLEKKGTKTIHIRSSTNSTPRASLNVGITLAGTFLKPMTIFKGKSGGTIASKELPTFPSEGLWACQAKAWCDEKCMLEWVDGAIKPWKAQVDASYPNHIPILILDSFKVHMMGSVVSYIQSLGVEVIHIPAGCTYLCQPVDVGINRPIKQKMAQLWEDWMIEEGAATNKTPPRKLIAEWIMSTLGSISENVVKQAWKKKDYQWVLE